jgi:glycosyltransferase involved in cell wall biosynthesis
MDAKGLKIAHMAEINPHKAGLYETTRDLVVAMRAAGVDSRIVDPIKLQKAPADRGVPIENGMWSARADLICSHSGLDKETNQLNKPIIHFLHGRPHSSFLLEQRGKIAVYTYLARIRRDERYKLFVTFWAEFLPYFKVILPWHKLRAIAPPVDLDLWSPDGPNGYGFHDHKGEINIVCASLWREDETPYHILNGFHEYACDNDGAKIHIYAAPQKGGAWEVLKRELDEKGMLGECVGMVTGLENVYRAADCVITPNRIATRSVREALACGCNVVMAGSSASPYTPFVADPQDVPGYAKAIARAVTLPGFNRATARHFFDANLTAVQLIELIEGI